MRGWRFKAVCWLLLVSMTCQGSLLASLQATCPMAWGSAQPCTAAVKDPNCPCCRARGEVDQRQLGAVETESTVAHACCRRQTAAPVAAPAPVVCQCGHTVPTPPAPASVSHESVRVDLACTGWTHVTPPGTSVRGVVPAERCNSLIAALYQLRQHSLYCTWQI